MIRRRTVDVIWLVAGLAVFAGSSAVAAQGPMIGEVAIFEAINSLPDALYYVIWPFMQYGVFVTIPVLVVVALLLRRFRLAAAMAIAGGGVYLLARLAKDLVTRERPAALLDGVQSRETFVEGSLGYPSGHVAVAAALTLVVTPYLPVRWRWVPIALLVAVLIGRLYVGAHLPLDLVGGAALGVSAGAAANLIVGVPVADEDVEVQPATPEPAT